MESTAEKLEMDVNIYMNRYIGFNRTVISRPKAFRSPIIAGIIIKGMLVINLSKIYKKIGKSQPIIILVLKGQGKDQKVRKKSQKINLKDLKYTKIRKIILKGITIPLDKRIIKKINKTSK